MEISSPTAEPWKGPIILQNIQDLGHAVRVAGARAGIQLRNAVLGKPARKVKIYRPKPVPVPEDLVGSRTARFK